MRIDIDYMKQILQIMLEDNHASIEMKTLIDALGVESSEENEEKFIKHIFDLYDLGCIDCRNADLGIHEGLSGRFFNVNVQYRLTVNGNRLLETMNNDTWWNKVKEFGKTITLETLRQAPSMILSKIAIG